MKTKPELINYTSDALEVLIYTKSGRLATGTSLYEIKNLWSHEKKLDHLAYMLDTIKTSFEFVHYIFDITDVSRAFTHQLVRTRTAAYQQESQRTVDVRNHSFYQNTDNQRYVHAIEISLAEYAKMIDEGVPVQDARGVLPTALHTRIFVCANLRTLSELSELRLCKRTEGEYQDVFKEIVRAVTSVHPWASPLLKVYCAKYGICAFPRYNKCPVKEHCFDPKTITDKIYEVWSQTDHVAIPVVGDDGKTM